MTSRVDALHQMMFQGLGGEQPAAIAAVPPHQRVLTPAEVKAAETTRYAREFTDTEAEKRQAQVARLRQARLEREEVERAEKAAAKATPKAKRKR